MSDKISQVLMAMGFTLESELVRDDFDGVKGDSVWSVTVGRNGGKYQTEYTHGCAFRHHKGGRAIDLSYGRVTVAEAEENKRTLPDEPAMADVMNSFVGDAQCVSDGQTFEDFADELGYDTDSRDAERIYNGCRDEYFALIRLGADLDVLSQMFQDY